MNVAFVSSGHELSSDPANGLKYPYVGAGIVWSVLQSVYASGNTSAVTSTTLADLMTDICHVLLSNLQQRSLNASTNAGYDVFGKSIETIVAYVGSNCLILLLVAEVECETCVRYYFR